MKMNRKLALGAVGLAFVFSGCASKNYSEKSPTDQDASLASKEGSSEDKDLEKNPPVFQEEYEAQQRGEVPTFDIPVVRNAKVEQWMDYFQGRGRKWMNLYMSRSGRYIPFMRKILRDHDQPEDLVYLAMIESGFNSNAYSRARAVGPWQFMKATGRLYGLRVDFWVDERRDPEKSTIAAARHLKDLYDQFQSWKLAAAAYNAGARKVSRAIQKYRTEDFWELTKGRYLKSETKNYVPKMIAAALIAKDPHKYGFGDVQYQDPLEYEKVVLDEPVNLMILAEKSDVALERIMDVNPELNHPVTPPNSKEYELRVPVGTSQQILQAYNSMSSEERFQYTAHQMRRGDTVAKLTKLYGVPTKEILKLNHLSSANEIHQGKTVLIPVGLSPKLVSLASVDTEPRRARRQASRVKKTAEKKIKVSDARSKVHVVRRGETLSAIAARYGTSVHAIKSANNLRRPGIQRGQKLHIPES